MYEFQIGYRAVRGDVEQAMIVNAYTAGEALTALTVRLGAQPWSIVRISERCSGTTRNGDPCQRWGTSDGYHAARCGAHRRAA